MKTSKNNEQKIISKSVLIWLLIIPLAILNGAFRDYITTPLMGDFLSRPLSGIMLCILIFIVSIWLIVVIFTGITPYLVAKIKQII